jgi:hypothetical protein
MKRMYNKFLIVSTAFILVGGVYLYFSNDLNKETVVPVAQGSSLASSLGIAPSPSSIPDESISSDISFLETLVSIKSLQIDTSLFTNRTFNALQNNAVKIEPVQPGRINPFAPMDATGATGNSVVTDEPTQVAARTAVLNGTVSASSGVSDTYFTYGTTEQSLTNTATATRQSLVGTFIKNVSGLTPKTTYFFRACAKINNVALCGETVSFTTN